MSSRVFRTMFFLLFLTFIFYQLSLSQETSKESNKFGFGAYAGVGAFIAKDKEVYGNIKTDFYPEIGALVDLYGVQLGLSIGYIYRNYKEYSWYWSPYESSSHFFSYKTIFIPIQANIKVYPIKFFDLEFPVQPYAGLGMGSFVAAGDNIKSIFAISGKMGVDITLIEYIVPFIDIKYTSAKADYATHDSFGKPLKVSKNFGGFFPTLGVAVRITF